MACLGAPLFAVALGAAGAAPVSGVLVDRVVAVVDKQVVTLSELLIEARVALALREGGDAALADLDDEILRHFLDYVVNQLLITQQARRLGAADVSQEEVDKALAQLALRFRSNDAYRAFLRRFEISEEALRNLIYRNIRNDKYMADRIRLRVGGRDGLIAKADFDTAVARWLAELRQTTEIRLLGPTGELELQPRGSAVEGLTAAGAGRSPAAALPPLGPGTREAAPPRAQPGGAHP